jgi:hypothetical protein
MLLVPDLVPGLEQRLRGLQVLEEQIGQRAIRLIKALRPPLLVQDRDQRVNRPHEIAEDP